MPACPVEVRTQTFLRPSEGVAMYIIDGDKKYLVKPHIQEAARLVCKPGEIHLHHKHTALLMRPFMFLKMLYFHWHKVGISGCWWMSDITYWTTEC